jgi:hypothetical protein
MPIGVATGFTGAVFVTPATGNERANVSAGSQRYSALVTRKRRSVRFADSKPRIKNNWMCCSWTEICVIYQWVI